MEWDLGSPGASMFIVTRKGMVVRLPVRLGDRVTKKDLYTGAHAVRVLANTMPMFDRLKVPR